MKKKILLLLIAIFTSMSMFSNGSVKSEDNSPLPPLWIKSVKVSVVCNPDGGYTYIYDIRLCQIPYSSLDNFHIYIRPDSGNSWTYGGTATQVGNDDYHFMLTMNSPTALNPQTWVMHPSEYYYDPSVVQLGVGLEQCGGYKTFTIPQAPDCNPVCDLPAPINVHVHYLSSGTLLHWNPVSGATGYIISASKVWNKSCSCRYPISIAPIVTTNSYAWLPSTLNCFMVHVTAVCANGSKSPDSDDVCVGGRRIPRLDTSTAKQLREVSITPNPTKGEMTFSITANVDTEVKVEMLDTYGTLIKSFVQKVISDKASTISWDGSNLKKGIYFVNFSTKEETIHKQVIVK